MNHLDQQVHVHFLVPMPRACADSAVAAAGMLTDLANWDALADPDCAPRIMPFADIYPEENCGEEMRALALALAANVIEKVPDVAALCNHPFIDLTIERRREGLAVYTKGSDGPLLGAVIGLVKACQEQLGAGKITFRWTAAHSDAYTEQTEGAVYISPSGGELHSPSPKKWMNAKPAPFRDLLQQQMESQRADFDLSDDFAREDFIKSCFKEAFEMTPALAGLRALTKEWGQEEPAAMILSESFYAEFQDTPLFDEICSQAEDMGNGRVRTPDRAPVSGTAAPEPGM